MKRNPLVLVVLFGLMATVRADVLLDDTWADGTRTNQNLPTDSAWWFSYSAATAQTNSMFVPMRPDNTAVLGVTYFTAGDTNPVRLAIGESLTASARLVFSNVPPALNGLLGFRIGLFNFADSTLSPIRVTNDLSSNNGQGSGVAGYALFQNMGTNVFDPSPVHIYKRTGLANSSLLGSIGAWTEQNFPFVTQTNGFPGFLSGQEYFWQMTVQRTGTTSLAISILWSNTSNSATISWSAADNLATNVSFDGIAMRPLNTNSAAAGYTFTEVRVDYGALPRDGFANVGYNTTGGAGGPVVTVTDAVSLSNYVNAAGSYVVQVKGTINLGATNFRVGANKTIIGHGTNATLIGNLYLLSVSNVIVRNLFLTNPSSLGEGDGVTVRNSNHIWFDHCTFTDCADGELDMAQATDYVTVSWCKFHYTFNSGHNFVNLLGSDDADIIDAGKLHVTFHHNWWSTLCVERMPRVRYGRVHSYNNYFNAPGNNYCVRAALESQVFLEKNWFENVDTPWEKFVTTGATGLVSAVSNVFVNVTGQTDPGTDTVFAVPYIYTLDSSNSLSAAVTNNAGAGKLGPGGSAFEQWQLLYFACTTCPQAAATADPDGDRSSNESEFIAGTDPADSASMFRIASIIRSNNDISVTWMTGVGKTNALDRTGGAAGSFSNNFAGIFTVTNTAAGTTNYLDLGAATNSPAFYYRVRLVQ
jgi:pectate lyase